MVASFTFCTFVGVGPFSRHIVTLKLVVHFWKLNVRLFYVSFKSYKTFFGSYQIIQTAVEKSWKYTPKTSTVQYVHKTGGHIWPSLCDFQGKLTTVRVSLPYLLVSK